MSIPLRALIVEDSEDDAELLLRDLRHGGYDVTSERVETAEGMCAALDRAAWDVILSDYTMPRFSALAALAVLRGRKLDVPFIIVSGTIGEETAVNAMKAGAHDYLLKGKLARLIPALERELRETEGRRERKRAEESLRKNEATLAEAQRISHVGSWEWDLTDNKFTWSEELDRIFGFEPGSVVPTLELALNAVDPGDRERVKQALENSIHLNTPYDIEFRVIHPDGTERFVHSQAKVVRNAAGKPSRMVGTLQDITEHKRAEEALAASEVRYRRLFESAKDGILILDAETGMVVDVNPFLIELLGSPQEHFLRKHIWDLGFFRDIVANKANFEELQRKDYIRYESLPLKTADGRPIDVEFVSNAYQVDGKKVIQCNVRDITERKRAEKQLRRLNRALRTISECNQVLVRATDELDLNHQICRILVEHGGFRMAWVGYAEQDEARSVRPVAQAGHDEGYLAEARITWADTERGRGPTGKAVRSRAVCFTRRTYLDPDYEPWRAAAMRHGFASMIGLPLVANGQTLGALTLYAGEVDAFDDAEVKLLTELANDLAYGIQALRVRAAHVQAEESLIRLRKAVEASGEVIFMTDRDGIITFINPEFTRVYGYTEAEVVGKATPRILKSATLQPADYANFWKTILEKRVARGEIVNKTKNGHLVSIHSSVNPVLDEGGQIAGFLAIQRDISERKQLEQQFRQSQKMEALGQLAGGVAHDFNNLLTVISGYSELLADGLGQDGPRLEKLKQIQNAAVRAASLTRQLLAFGRRQTMVMEVMDINSAVARVEKMLHRVIGENVELITRPAPGLGHVKADPGQVEQVIINLAINARDAMPQGGKLIIATANVEVAADDGRCRSGLKPGAYVSLTVADTGSGIDPKIKANIFEPFFTTKERGKGTGLGLATVYGIVQQSGGFVGVETELGSGSTFQVLLPRIEQGITPPAMEPTTMTHRPCTETVLVVEDEPPLLTMVRGILESCGYRVLEAAHGVEALAICERHEGPIDLVLTDVVMPQMGGPELALRLASRWPQVRILYMSGYTDDAFPDAALPGAKRTFITKPFTPKALTSKVREALDAK